MKKILILLVLVAISVNIANAQIVKSSMSRVIVTENKINYPNKGYRGFAEAGFGGGETTVDYGHNYGSLKYFYDQYLLSTIHGAQIIPQLFVGGGLGVHSYVSDDDEYDDYDGIAIPIFADVRSDFIKYKISPFADMRLGYSIGDIEGLYFGLSVGVRLNHINLSIGYVMQESEYSMDKYESFTSEINSVLFRVAFDWGARK